MRKLKIDESLNNRNFDSIIRDLDREPSMTFLSPSGLTNFSYFFSRSSDATRFELNVDHLLNEDPCNGVCFVREDPNIGWIVTISGGADISYMKRILGPAFTEGVTLTEYRRKGADVFEVPRTPLPEDVGINTFNLVLDHLLHLTYGGKWEAKLWPNYWLCADTDPEDQGIDWKRLMSNPSVLNG